MTMTCTFNSARTNNFTYLISKCDMIFLDQRTKPKVRWLQISISMFPSLNIIQNTMIIPYHDVFKFLVALLISSSSSILMHDLLKLYTSFFILSHFILHISICLVYLFTGFSKEIRDEAPYGTVLFLSLPNYLLFFF